MFQNYLTTQSSNKMDRTNVVTHTYTHIPLQIMPGVLKDFRTSANYSAVPSGAWGTEAGNYSSKTVFQITSF